jgi:hypothetical protein
MQRSIFILPGAHPFVNATKASEASAHSIPDASGAQRCPTCAIALCLAGAADAVE